MNRRIRRLEHELALEQAAPELDVTPIKQRVNAALNTDPSERKAYMRQKIKMAAVLVAAAVALTGTALAVASNIDVLQIFFKGDTSSAQGLVDAKSRTVSSKDFSFTVESSASDEQNAYLVVRVDALNDTAAEKLMSDGFVNMDTFDFYAVTSSNEAPPEDFGVDETSGAYVSGVPELSGGSWGVGEVGSAKTDTSRTWTIEVGLPEKDGAVALRARLCYMEADQYVELPLTPAEAVTVKIGASGQGSPTYYSRSGGPLTIESVTLTPFTCRVEATTDNSLNGKPRIFFRMKDGTLYTQSQMMAPTESSGDAGTSKASYSYRFNEVLDLTQLSALVVFDREYPLDGSPSFPVAHNPALDTFELPLMPRLVEGGGFTVSVRALAEGLGGACAWDNATQTATLTYRDVSIALTLGSKTALVNGSAVQLNEAPGAEDGKLIADTGVFRDRWGVELFAFYETIGANRDRNYLCWIVIP